MAQLASFLTPESDPPVTATIASAGVSAAIPIAGAKKFSITCMDANLTPTAFQVAYGSANVVATSASDMFPPGKFTLQAGRSWTHISIYNPTSGNITYFVAPMQNT